MLPWLCFFSFENLPDLGEKNQERNRAVPAEAMSLWPCELSTGHLVGWGVPRGLLSLPSLSCPLSHHNGCGFWLIFTADLQPESGTEKGKDAQWQSLSAAIPSPSYISNDKGIPNKMLLPVYNSVIPFFSQGQKIGNWMGIIVFVSEGGSLWNTALTEAWGELAGLGWEAFLPVSHHTLIMLVGLHFTLLIIKNSKTRTENALKSFQLTGRCVITYS